MPKRERFIPSPLESTIATELRSALTGRKKAELVDLLVELAEGDRGVLRQLASRLAVPMTPANLIVTTRHAIADATRFDEREINRNFAYDYQAYGTVKQNLSQLVASGQWKPAMELALELMEQGSYQVEMSDEGLMTEDIEDCLRVVIEAIGNSSLPDDVVTAWSLAMLASDRVGFIAHEPLQALRNQSVHTADE
jgi:hypothetical protein